jgi:hypothetical protein
MLMFLSEIFRSRPEMPLGAPCDNKRPRSASDEAAGRGALLKISGFNIREHD